MHKFLLVLLAFLYTNVVVAQTPGTLDPTFNPADNASFGNGPNGPVLASVQQPDGKIIIAGNFTVYNGQPVSGIIRLHADGRLDTEFQTAIRVGADPVWNISLALQPDGKLLVASPNLIYNNQGNGRWQVLRLNTNGTRDESFGFNNGSLPPFTSVNRILVLPDGRIAIGGYFPVASAVSRTGVRILNGTDGSVTLSANFGLAANGGNSLQMTALAMQPDGRFLVAGTPGIIRLNADLTPDNSFSCIVNQIPTALAVQSDGKIIIGGSFTTVNGAIRNGISRQLANGGNDNSFNPGTGFFPLNNPYNVLSIALLLNNQLLIGGRFEAYKGREASTLIKLNADGSQDLNYRNDTEMPADENNIVACITPLNNGKFLVGGSLISVNPTRRKNLVVLDANGRTDRSFNPRRGFNEIVHSVTAQTDGKIITGGAFTSFNDTANNYLARLLPNGSRDNAFSDLVNFNGPVFATAIQPDGRILVAGNFTVIQGQKRQSMVRLLNNGLLDNSFNLQGGASDSIRAIAVRPDGRIIIGGAFNSAGGVSANRIALLESNGVVVGSFSPQGANGTVTDLLVRSNNQVYVTGGFTSINGANRSGIARLSSSGAVDNTFQPNPAINGEVLAVDSLSNGSVVVGGAFTQTIASIIRKSITALLPSGAVDISFDAGTGLQYDGAIPGRVLDLEVTTGNVVIAAGFFQIYKNTRFLGGNGIMVINGDGNINEILPWFAEAAGGYVYKIALQGDHLIFGGSFTALRDGNLNNRTLKTRLAKLFLPIRVGNDEPCTATTLTPGSPGDTSCTNPISGTLTGSTTSAFAGCTAPDEDVWYKFVATRSTHFLKVSNTGAVNTQIAVYGGTACGNLGSSCVGSGSSSSNMFYTISGLTAGSVYYIQIKKTILNPQASAAFTLCLLTALNDEACNAVIITPRTAGDTSSAGNNTGQFIPATTSGTNAGALTSLPSGDVWYSFRATDSTHIIRASAASGRPLINIYRSDNCTNPGTSLSASASNLGLNLIGFNGLKPDSLYFVKIGEGGAINNDASFKLAVLTPINDRPCKAITIVPGAQGDTTGAYTNADLYLSTFGGNRSCSQLSNPDIWYKFRATASTHIVQADFLNAGNLPINITAYPAAICGNSNTSAITCLEASKPSIKLERLSIGADYYVRLSYGLIISNLTQCRLRILSGPPNDVPCTAIALTPGAVGDESDTNFITGSSLNAGYENDQPYNEPSVWYKFIATAPKHIIKVNSGSSYSYFKLFSDASCNTRLQAIDLSAVYTVGQTYYISVVSVRSNFQIGIFTPKNDEPCTATVISPLPAGIATCTTPVLGNITFATATFPPSSTNYNAADLWYRFTAIDSNHIIKLNRFGGGRIDLWKGSTCNAGFTLSNQLDSVFNTTREVEAISISSSAFEPNSVYFIRISNGRGLANTNSFSLCLFTGQSNTNACKAATIIPAAAGDTSFANPITGNGAFGGSRSLTGCGSQTTNKELWYKFTALATRHFLRYTGTQKAYFTLYKITAANTVSNNCQITNPSTKVCDSITSLSGLVPLANLLPGDEYYLRLAYNIPVSGAASAPYAFKILTPPPAGYNDSICNAIPLGTCADTTGHVMFATPDVEGSVCGAGTVNEVWYKFTAPPSGILSVRSITAGFKPKVRFITLADCKNPASITSQNCDFADQIQMTEFTAGTEYYMGVGISEADAAINGNAGNFSIQLANTTVIGANYTISTTNSICQGTKVTFTGSASDAGANPGYDWLINSVFTGATGRVFVCDTLKNGDKVQVRIIPGISCLSPRTSQSTTFNVAPATRYFKDADKDGFGQPGSDTLACTPPAGFVTNSNDCNDTDKTINASFGFYTDADGDGFGVNPLLQVCAANAGIAPAGYSLNNTDLDDNDGGNNPHAPRAEYFIDTDPGPGKGIALPFTSSIDSIKIQTGINTSELAAGFHTLGIRVFSQGNWSLFEPRGFYLLAPDAEAASISEGEYFVDTDPGAGKAKPTGFSNANDTALAQFRIPMEGIIGGFHTLAVRFKDANGKWGMFENRGFYIESNNTEAPLPVAAEYFVDTDPGAGKGTPIATTLPADTVTVADLLPATTLSPGFHTLAIRMKDSKGNWGLFEPRGFYLDAPEPANNTIVAAEYFLTTDPGTGAGKNLPIGTNADSIGGTLNVTIPPSVTAGNYFMGTRVKDSQGRWSLFEYDTLTVASNSTNLTLLFTSICAGTATLLPFTANGIYNSSNTFTAQLSNAGGDFTIPTNIGSLSATGSGSISVTIPANTAPGLGYRIRVVSSSPAGAAIIATNGFAINGRISTDDASVTQSLLAQPNHLLDAQCRLLTSLLPGGSNPVNGMVTGRVWVEDNVPLNNEVPFVGRHYQITPSINAATATATVTLYFTQAEFNAYNNHPNTTLSTRLPASPTDLEGISRLLVIKFSGSSSNGTGLPVSYTGDTTAIDPGDSAIVWNNSLERWEVSFDVRGFSGFIVTAAPNILMGPLKKYHYWTGLISEEWENPLNWASGVPTSTGTAIVLTGTPYSPVVKNSTKVWAIELYEGTFLTTRPGVLLEIMGKKKK